MDIFTQTDAIEYASNLTKIDKGELKIRLLDNAQGFYVYQPIRGGKSLIIANDKSVLFVSSAINFSDHLKAFNDGARSEIDQAN